MCPHDPSLESPLRDSDGHEIIIPHDREIRPVSAVKNVVLQSSLAQLEKLGMYQRYEKVVEPGVIEAIRAGSFGLVSGCPGACALQGMRCDGDK